MGKGAPGLPARGAMPLAPDRPRSPEENVLDEPFAYFRRQRPVAGFSSVPGRQEQVPLARQTPSSDETLRSSLQV